MEQNLYLAFEKGCFTVRAIALVIHNRCLLAAKNEKYDCYYTVGGGVHCGESSAGAALRELQEETGFCAKIDRLVFIQERFFSHDGKKHHEIAFFHLIQDADFPFENGMPTDASGERLYWLPIDELPQMNLVPGFLRTALQSIPESPIHIISYE